MAKKKRQSESVTNMETEELLALATDWERVVELDNQNLDQLVFVLTYVYGKGDGQGNHPNFLISTVQGIYDHYQSQIGPEQRKANYEAMMTQVDCQEVKYPALLPYLFMDEDTGIASTASLDYAMYRKLDDGDPLTGPKEIIGHIQEKGLANTPAVFGGLVMLGDARVMALLKPVRSIFSPLEVETIIRCRSGLLHAATVYFYLDWLEQSQREGDEQLFGILAACMCNMAFLPKQEVREIERNFPAIPGKDGTRCLRKWSFEEFSRQIAPKLRRIAAAETGDRIMPEVLAAWGLQ